MKLSIRGRIVDSMVGTTLTIEREIEDARSTRDAGVGSKWEDQPSSSFGEEAEDFCFKRVSGPGPGFGM